LSIHRYEIRNDSTGRPGYGGYGGDGGPAEKAQLAPRIALDKSDNVYICDIMNNRVRRNRCKDTNHHDVRRYRRSRGNAG
jgi:hypothetical protein